MSDNLKRKTCPDDGAREQLDCWKFKFASFEEGKGLIMLIQQQNLSAVRCFDSCRQTDSLCFDIIVFTSCCYLKYIWEEMRRVQSNPATSYIKPAHKGSLFPLTVHFLIPTASLTAADCVCSCTPANLQPSKSLFLWHRVFCGERHETSIAQH